MSVSGKSFPFWLLVYRDGSAWRPVVREAGYALAFSSTNRALDYFAEHGNSDWEFRLICRETLARMMNDFREQGVLGVSLDATSELPGRRVAFEDL